MQTTTPLYTLKAVNGSYSSILPGLGATVHRLALTSPDGSLHDILRGDEDENIQANRGFRGRLMFPFCGRIKGGRYQWQGIGHQLPCNNNGNALHGFVYRHAMTTVEQSTADSLSLVWALAADQEAGYPFALQLQADYRIDSEGFRLRLTATNTGSNRAPVSLGWHPYFRLDSAPSGWQIASPSSTYIPMGPDLFPCGPESPVAGTAYDFSNGQTLGTRQLDGPIRNAGAGIIELYTESEDYRIRIQADPALFGYYQLFTPPLRDCLAIEPVSAISGAFAEPELGLRCLEPGKSLSGDIKISLVAG